MPGPPSPIGASIVAIIDRMSCLRFQLTLILKIFPDPELDVTGLGKSHGKSPQLHIKIFVDDEKTPSRETELEKHNSTYKIPQPIDL
jgi:hypothetical protein